jgi:hypothetical protein
MKQLEKSFTGKGKEKIFKFDEVYKDGLYRVYQKTDGINYYYEAIRVIEEKDVEMFGKMVEAHERYPSNEDFGISAYCCLSIDNAMNRIEEMKSRIINN